MANLREAYDYAKNNPNSDFAISLQEALGSGSLDEEAQKFGIDTSVFKPQQAVTQPQEKQPTTFKEAVVNPITSRLGEVINRPGQDYSTPTAALKTTLSTGLQGASAAVSGVTDAGLNLVKEGASTLTGGYSDKALEALGNALGEKVGQVINAIPEEKRASFSQFIDQHPELAANTGALANLALTFAGTGVLGKTSKAVGALETRAAQATTAGKETIDLAKTKATEIKSSMVAASEKKAQDNYDNLVRAITQGKKTDIDKASQALSMIDTKGVKTYDELAKRYDTKVGELSSVVDKALELEPRILTQNDSPYLGDAIQQLKDYYTKINNREALAPITALEQKFTTQGISLKEANDLAKLHGQDLNAFSPVTGELSTGLSKQAAENTRNGIKNAIRNNAESEVYKQADSQLSNMLSAKDTSEKMAEKVAMARQRYADASLGKKVGYMIGSAIDVASFGTAKGIGAKLVQNTKELELNPMEIEKLLEKRLKKLDKIFQGKNEADVTRQLEQFISETKAENEKMLSLPSGEGKKAIPLSAPASKPLTAEEKIANDFTQNLRRAKNIKTLPAPKSMQLPNTRGTPNPIGRPYVPNEQGAVGGSSRAKTKLK